MIDLKQDVFAPAHSIFDTHAHYDDICFDETRDELLSNLFSNGVGFIINNSTDLLDSAEKCLEISEKHERCYTAIGLHPESVESHNMLLDEVRLLKLLQQPKVVAVGEIGLDYHYSSVRKEQQKQVFRRQCEIANELNLPIIVHDRDAHGDTMEILNTFKPKGSVHCFSGSREMALELVKIGFYIGVGGVVTFKNARKLVETVETIPLNRILLETDAPYLAPSPYRSNTCHSAYIYYTAKRIAEIKNTTVENVLAITCYNAQNLFFRGNHL